MALQGHNATNSRNRDPDGTCAVATVAGGLEIDSRETVRVSTLLSCHRSTPLVHWNPEIPTQY